jgi:hypothetical protein
MFVETLGNAASSSKIPTKCLQTTVRKLKDGCSVPHVSAAPLNGMLLHISTTMINKTEHSRFKGQGEINIKYFAKSTQYNA